MKDGFLRVGERPGSRHRSGGVRGLRWAVGVLALFTMSSACDSLLEVELPGQLVDADLNDPQLAETLVLSAQADFECGLAGYQMVTGSWANEIQYIHTGQFIGLIRYDTRQFLSRDHVGPCKGVGADWNPSWFPLHLSRTMAAEAVQRIETFPEGVVGDPDFLIGKARAYEGYSTLLLSEAFCGIVFEGDGVVRDRSEGFQRAEALFTDALNRVSASGAEESAAIADLARVGRARARLNLGNGAGVLEDAQAVSEGFVHYATYDRTPTRRQSQMQQVNNEWYTLHPDFRAVEVQGVPDPRLPTVDLGTTQTGADWWEQRKFPDEGTDIPFASWREAQLMIAEVEGGQVAVDVINLLRDTYGLPHFESSNEDEIRDQLRRERRIELFQQATKLGDDLRWGTHVDWDVGTNPIGHPYGDETCMPVPDIEFL